MRESVIEAYLVRSIRELGGDCRKVKWIGRRAAPDRLVMVPARPRIARSDLMKLAIAVGSVPLEREPVTLWIELKATGKKPTPAQLREHQRMRALGQDVRVIDSVEGVDALVQELMA